MINQVDFEGYLTRAWEYREQRYMRLANHRPGENGQDILGLRHHPDRPSPGFRSAACQDWPAGAGHGRIVGRDIVEPLKSVVSKSHDGVELPGELNNLVIRRPTSRSLPPW